jgi:hypothetical protein
MRETQDVIDAARSAGKLAYFGDVGTHGPTFKPRKITYSANPYKPGSKCHESWQRGYNQDVRRVIADR